MEDTSTLTSPIEGKLPPSRRLSLRRNFSWTLAGNLIYAASQWGIMIVLARRGSAEMLGQYALALAVVGPVMDFSLLSLRSVQAADAFDQYRFQHYLALRLITTVLALLIVSGLAASYGGVAAMVILLIGLTRALDAVRDVIAGLFQNRERMDFDAQGAAAYGVGSLVALSVTLWLTHDIRCCAASLVAVSCISLCGYYLPAVRRLLGESAAGDPTMRPCFDGPRLRQLAWLSLPAGLTVLMISLEKNIPRYILEYRFSERDLGVFAAIAQFRLIGMQFVQAAGRSINPRLAQYHAAGEVDAFRRLLLVAMGLAGLLGLIGLFIAAVAGRWILDWMYGPEFGNYSIALVLTMTGAALGYMTSCLHQSLSACWRFRVQLIIMLIALSTCCAAAAILIPVWGIIGAAAALLVSSIVRFLSAATIQWIVLREMRREKERVTGEAATA